MRLSVQAVFATQRIKGEGLEALKLVLECNDERFEDPHRQLESRNALFNERPVLLAISPSLASVLAKKVYFSLILPKSIL